MSNPEYRRNGQLMAAAAAMAGDTRCVRPPFPCRPSKLRLLVAAHRSPGASLSGFMARHMLQPASRHSNPASRKIRSSPSCSACAFTSALPGTTIACTRSDARYPRTTAAAARRSSIRPFVHEPINTRSTGISVSAHARLQAHVLERLSGRLAFGLVGELARVGHPLSDGQYLAGVRAPRDLRRHVGRLVDVDHVVGRAGIGRELGPAGHGRVEVARRELAAAQVVVGRRVRSDHAGPRPGLDRHVADRHPLFHAQGPDRRAGVFEHVAGAAVGGELANQVQDQVLGRYAAAQLAVDPQLHRFGQCLEQRLRGQHVLHFAGADPERQRAERAVRGGVAVAADDRHARLRVAQLRADHVDDPLVSVLEVVQADAELAAVFAQRIDLLPRDRVGDRLIAIGGRDVVVGCGHRPLGPADLAAGQSQPFKGLRAGDLVDQLQVDVENRLFAGFRVDDVVVPDLLEHGPRCGGRRSHRAFRKEISGRIAVLSIANAPRFGVSGGRRGRRG